VKESCDQKRRRVGGRGEMLVSEEKSREESRAHEVVGVGWRRDLTYQLLLGTEVARDM
jgi:hypothetical protein